MVNYHTLYFKLLFEHHRTYLKPFHKLISCLTIMYEFRKTGSKRSQISSFFFSRHVIETCFFCALMYILLENIIYMSKSLIMRKYYICTCHTVDFKIKGVGIMKQY